MEDKRVIKTRKNIKATLVRLLEQKRFEDITVAELCREGVISRITFYTYYDNKYALVSEMFSDYIKQAAENYHRMQKLNNSSDNAFVGYQNLLECILALFFDNYDFFSHTTAKENPYLFSEFFNHIFCSVDDYLKRHTGLVAQHPTKQIAALLCSGLFGVINTCSDEKMSENELKNMTRAIYKDLLESKLFCIK